uniref:Uncharacterized protein n=1 Tax=Arundo donax TaxID=35708 RepID=A0A0A9BD51_ARUDO
MYRQGGRVACCCSYSILRCCLSLPPPCSFTTPALDRFSSVPLFFFPNVVRSWSETRSEQNPRK